MRIPLSTGINGWTVGGIVKACRDNVMSRWLIHAQRAHGNSKHGNQVWVDTISKNFAKARDLAGVTGDAGKQPPSFHEIRSLAIRLYTKQFDKDFAQAIAGHKDASMTAVYGDVRGSEWIQVAS